MIADFSFEKGKRRGAGRMIVPLTIIRFLLIPACFYIAYFTFLRKAGLNSAQLWILFIETHTSPALNLSVMAIQAGVNEDLTTFSLLITYLIYLFVLPIYLLIFFSLPGVL